MKHANGQQVMKGTRLPRVLIKQIEQLIKADGSTVSQFIRTAVIRELNARQRVTT